MKYLLVLRDRKLLEATPGNGGCVVAKQTDLNLDVIESRFNLFGRLRLTQINADGERLNLMRLLELLGERLRDVPFDLVIASDLDRTRETAEAVATSIELDPAWREMDLGEWENTSFEDPSLLAGMEKLRYLDLEGTAVADLAALADIDGDGALDIVGQDSYSGQSKPWLYRNLRRDLHRPQRVMFPLSYVSASSRGVTCSGAASAAKRQDSPARTRITAARAPVRPGLRIQAICSISRVAPQASTSSGSSA